MSHFVDDIRRRLTSALSLSERTIRSLAAIIGGASTLLTETLFPEAVRGTTIYNVTIGMMQQYIVERVAGMESEAAEDHVELSEDYIQRKMAGTLLEIAGLFTIGFSPLWVFAIAGDLAAGSKVYLHRLVERLKKDGIVAEKTEATELADVLEAIQDASSKSAMAIDTPPLSREELAKLADEVKISYGQAFGHTTNLRPQLDAVWERMEQLARRENISIERLSGIMTVNAASWSKSRVDTALVAGQVGAELFDEKILDSYRKTLAEALERGVDEYVHDHMRPFLESASSHFDPSRTTWIERKLGDTSTNSERGGIVNNG